MPGVSRLKDGSRFEHAAVLPPNTPTRSVTEKHSTEQWDRLADQQEMATDLRNDVEKT